jgi:FtsP/CotA-like multicopper oxidase with cupredoxin domain
MDGATIPKFVEPLPTFVGSRVDGTRPLSVTMVEHQQQILPASVYAGLAAPFQAGSYVWAYRIHDGAKAYGPLYPAFTIEARQDQPTVVKYTNELRNPKLLDPGFVLNPNGTSILPYDQSIHWADPTGMMAMPGMGAMGMEPYRGPVPAVVHLHGGEVPSAYDGGPDSWFTPGEELKGKGFVSNTYTYPNRQEATTLFFHDHALGATRLNLYAGLVGFYFLRDLRDTGASSNPIKLPAGPQEIELAIQDKQFDQNGQLYFPNVGVNPETHPFWAPEFFGDTIVVNGKTWPFLNVEPRRYRFRIVNGSNARFFHMQLFDDKSHPGPAFWQVGTDGGLLDRPVPLHQLLLAPGERADVIVDFGAAAGRTFTLKNDALAPFPDGDPADPATVGQIMQFRVALPLSAKDKTYNPALFAPLRDPIHRLWPSLLVPGLVGRRQLTLNEVQGAGGPLEVLVNNSKWGATPTEQPQVGSTEVWEIINMTMDAHPIHLHLVQFQALSRQPFDAMKYGDAYGAAFAGGAFKPAAGPPRPYDRPNAAGALGGNPDVTPYLMPGQLRLPNLNELGWKDTLIMYPGEVTRVIIRWAPQERSLLATRPGRNDYAFDPTAPQGTTDAFGFPGGPGYVWHCHIVDHEDNEMMRPQVISNTRPPFPGH